MLTKTNDAIKASNDVRRRYGDGIKSLLFGRMKALFHVQQPAYHRSKLIGKDRTIIMEHAHEMFTYFASILKDKKRRLPLYGPDYWQILRQFLFGVGVVGWCLFLGKQDEPNVWWHANFQMICESSNLVATGSHYFNYWQGPFDMVARCHHNGTTWRTGKEKGVLAWETTSGGEPTISVIDCIVARRMQNKGPTGNAVVIVP